MAERRGVRPEDDDAAHGPVAPDQADLDGAAVIDLGEDGDQPLLDEDDVLYCEPGMLEHAPGRQGDLLQEGREPLELFERQRLQEKIAGTFGVPRQGKPRFQPFSPHADPSNDHPA